MGIFNRAKGFGGLSNGLNAFCAGDVYSIFIPTISSLFAATAGRERGSERAGHNGK